MDEFRRKENISASKYNLLLNSKMKYLFCSFNVYGYKLSDFRIHIKISELDWVILRDSYWSKLMSHNPCDISCCEALDFPMDRIGHQWFCRKTASSVIFFNWICLGSNHTCGEHSKKQLPPSFNLIIALKDYKSLWADGTSDCKVNWTGKKAVRDNFFFYAYYRDLTGCQRARTLDLESICDSQPA